MNQTCGFAPLKTLNNNNAESPNVNCYINNKEREREGEIFREDQLKCRRCWKRKLASAKSYQKTLKLLLLIFLSANLRVGFCFVTQSQERESLTVNYIFFVSLLLFYLMGFIFFLFFLHFLDFKNLPNKSRTWSVEYFGDRNGDVAGSEIKVDFVLLIQRT